MSDADKPNNTDAASDSEDEQVFHDARFPPDEEADLLAQSNTQKSHANSLFTSSNFSEALTTYDRALSFLPNYLDYDIAVLRSNIAACHLRLEDWKAAVEAASASIKCLDQALAEVEKGSNNGENDTKNADKNAPNNDTSGVVELSGEDDQADSQELAKLAALDSRRDDIKRIRGKALMRRARGKMELDGWANLQGAEEDYRALLALDTLPPADERAVKAKLRELPNRINVARDKEVGEMMGKLKDLGNGILKPFGLSTDNFKFDKDEKTGGYNMSFQQ